MTLWQSLESVWQSHEEVKSKLVRFSPKVLHHSEVSWQDNNTQDNNRCPQHELWLFCFLSGHCAVYNMWTITLVSVSVWMDPNLVSSLTEVPESNTQFWFYCCTHNSDTDGWVLKCGETVHPHSILHQKKHQRAALIALHKRKNALGLEQWFVHGLQMFLVDVANDLGFSVLWSSGYVHGGNQDKDAVY